MKILVAVKRVLDYNVKVRIKPDHSDVDLTNAKMSMNPFDEIAVEEALRLKEKGVATEVVVCSIGSKASQETIRQALALGADRGILVETDESLEPLSIAKILRELVKQESPRLVLLGKQSIDGDHNQTGQILAGLLNWPQGTFVSKINLKDDFIEVTREVDAGLETLSLTLPAVITTDLRLNEPRYASLPNIMRAKQKPLQVIPLSTLPVNTAPKITRLQVEPPPPRQAGVIMVNSVSELLDKLRLEAKVLGEQTCPSS